MIVLPGVPLYADDRTLGEALLGKKKAATFVGIALALEAEGLPKVDLVLGGRYVPAVLAFLQARHGLADKVATAPDGGEQWNRRSQTSKGARARQGSPHSTGAPR